MGLYTNKGLYNSYDKNHKERDKLDYYATPPVEVVNILDLLDINFSNQTILEPCCGGGHMAQGILEYLDTNGQKASLIATDIHKHEQMFRCNTYSPLFGEEYDFLSDEYPYAPDSVDWIIMNPPYATIEPFVIRSFEIAKRGIIMLGRLQFLEGEKRFNNIFSQKPPSEIYVYVERIQCWKQGIKPDGSSAQAYAWFVWDFQRTDSNSIVHWIHRA